MVINPLNDVMTYFRFSFFAYIVLFIIIILNFCKSLYIKRNLPTYNSSRKLIQYFDLIIDIFCGLAMASGLIFHGILADNNAIGYKTWIYILDFISFASLIIFILNVIVVFKRKK